MSKNIKIRTKPKNNNIRKFDRQFVYTKNMREKLLKRNRLSYKNQTENEENEISYATDTAMFTSERIGVNTAYGVKDTTKYGYDKIKKYIKDKKNQKEDEASNSLNQDNPIINNKEKSIEEINKNKLLNEKSKEKNIFVTNELKTNNNSKIQTLNNKVSNVNFQEPMKKYSINKIRTNNLKNKKNNIVKTKNVAKKTVNSLKNFAEKVIRMAKSLVVILASGGGIAIIIVIIAVLIAGMFGSAFGFLFSNETPKTEENMSVNSAVNFLDNEIDEKISHIKATTDYDSMRIENRSVVWRDVLSVYAVITTNRETKFDIMKIDDYNYDKLREIFWEVVEVEHYTETYKVRVVTTDAEGNKVVKTKTKTRLIINVQAMSLEEMMEYFNMSKAEKKPVEEMMDGQFDEMWNVILNVE